MSRKRSRRVSSSSNKIKPVYLNKVKSLYLNEANPVSALAFRPVEQLVQEADERLADVEGGALEKLVGQLYEERSRKGVGDFPLTQRIQGHWDKADIEIDLVAVNRTDKVIRFASCKRAPAKLLSDINNFKGHVDRFLTTMPQYKNWEIQYAGVAPVLDRNQRKVLARHDVIAQDLRDLTKQLK